MKINLKLTTAIDVVKDTSALMVPHQKKMAFTITMSTVKSVEQNGNTVGVIRINGRQRLSQELSAL